MAWHRCAVSDCPVLAEATLCDGHKHSAVAAGAVTGSGEYTADVLADRVRVSRAWERYSSAMGVRERRGWWD